MRSMTGFGRGDAAAGGRGVRCELKTVNNRGLDVRVRTDRDLATFEQAVQATLKGALRRGRVDVTLVLERGAAARGALRFDEAMADRIVDQLHAFARRRGDIGKHVDVNQLVLLSDLFVLESAAEDDETLGELVDIALAAAMNELQGAREAEGEQLAKDLGARLDTVAALLTAIGERTADAPIRLRDKLQERLDAASAADVVAPERLAQEVALLAERADVSEELTRLGIHIERFRALAAEEGAVGRKLDFLCQELNREANTVASKCSDAETAHLVVDLKAEIERVREQVQNVE